MVPWHGGGSKQPAASQEERGAGDTPCGGGDHVGGPGQHRHTPHAERTSQRNPLLPSRGAPPYRLAEASDCGTCAAVTSNPSESQSPAGGELPRQRSIWKLSTSWGSRPPPPSSSDPPSHHIPLSPPSDWANFQILLRAFRTNFPVRKRCGCLYRACAAGVHYLPSSCCGLFALTGFRKRLETPAVQHRLAPRGSGVNAFPGWANSCVPLLRDQQGVGGWGVGRGLLEGEGAPGANSGRLQSGWGAL